MSVVPRNPEIGCGRLPNKNQTGVHKARDLAPSNSLWQSSYLSFLKLCLVYVNNLYMAQE